MDDATILVETRGRVGLGDRAGPLDALDVRLVASAVPVDLFAGALRTGTVAGTVTAAPMVKESAHRAAETSLAEGIRSGRRLSRALFATPDQENMAAPERRTPEFGRPGREG